MSRQPHDIFFRWLFQHVDVAADHLARTLPSELTRQLDLRTLRLDETALVRSSLRRLEADLLYEVELRDGSATLSVLIEHRSSQKGEPVPQVMGDSVAACERRLEGQARGSRWPLLLPIILYHGPRPWSSGHCLADRLAGSARARATFGQLGPQLRFLLHDLSRFRDEDFDGHPLRALGLTLMKHAFDAELSQHCKARIKRRFKAVLRLGPFESARIPLHCFLETRPWTERHELEEFIMQTVPEPLHEEALTWGDYLRAQGRQQGQTEGERRVVLRLLEVRFSDAAPEVAARIQAESDPEVLERWAERLLTIDRPEELFDEE